MILSSDVTVTAVVHTSMFGPPLAILRRPSLQKLGSRTPSAVNNMMPCFSLSPDGELVTTIRSSDSNATSTAAPDRFTHSMIVAFGHGSTTIPVPSEPNVVSKLPSVLNRAINGSNWDPFIRAPATTTFPDDCTTTDAASNQRPVPEMVFQPSVSNVVSRSPVAPVVAESGAGDAATSVEAINAPATKTTAAFVARLLSIGWNPLTRQRAILPSEPLARSRYHSRTPQPIHRARLGNR